MSHYDQFATVDQGLIQWRESFHIPRTQGTRITVKDQDGELHNLTVGKNGYLPIPASDIRGWIPNNQ